MKKLVVWLLFCSLGFTPGYAAAEYDVVVYGGTSAGVIAAVQTAKMGHSVILVSPDEHLGGLTTGGLGWTDSGDKSAIGGLSREFYQRIHQHYENPDAWKYEEPSELNKNRGFGVFDPDDDAMWVFEPHVAENLMDQMLEEQEVSVIRDAWLDREKGVNTKNGRIVSIMTLDGNTYEGKMFIDATYEGDLMASAGVSYAVGRESNRTYNERYNGVQKDARHHGHYFTHDVDPYIVPGDPSSGILPRVHAGDPGNNGDGDHRVQAYCFRMCMTDVAENLVPWPKPEGYDEQEYELLLRNYEAGDMRIPLKIDMMPNRKTDTNNNYAFSTDNIGMNYDYPEGGYERRKEIIAEHEQYQKGLMWTLANHPRVPKEVREKVSRWGLAADEFIDNGNWPHQIYVREARRMIGEYIMTEHDCLRTVDTPKSVGLGSYTMDSHNVQRYITTEGYVQNEGDIGVHPGGPYEISYESLVPKKDECENLLVPVCVSSSHIAFGSIRMEPVFMILGQSAATAAVLSLRENTAVQDLDYELLKAQLLEDGQVLETDVPPKQLPIKSAQLEGIVVDDRDAELSGNWDNSASISPFVDQGYHYSEPGSDSVDTARYEANLKPGRYIVRLSYSPHNNRATNLSVTIHHATGKKTVTVNQQREPSINELFIELGVFDFDDHGVVEFSTRGVDGHVIADAVQWVLKE